MATEIVLTPTREFAGSQVPPELQPSLAGAAALWNRALSRCHAPKLLANLNELSEPRVHDDEVNAVLVHEQSWCPPSMQGRGECYPADVLARSHIYPSLAPGSREDGVIRGVDIEINAVYYRWSHDGKRGGTLSLRTILLHELGHVLGLDHPCGPNSEWSYARKVMVPCPAVSTGGVMYPNVVMTSGEAVVAPSDAEVAAVCAAHAGE